MEAIPPKPVFDSMLRKIIVENAANDAFTPARPRAVADPRASRSDVSMDGGNQVIAKFAAEMTCEVTIDAKAYEIGNRIVAKEAMTSHYESAIRRKTRFLIALNSWTHRCSRLFDRKDKTTPYLASPCVLAGSHVGSETSQHAQALASIPDT